MAGMNPHRKPQPGQAGPSAPRARRLNSRVPLILKEKRTPPKKVRLPAKEKTPLSATPDGNIPGKMLSSLSTDTLLFGAFLLFGTFVPMQFGVVVTAANDLVGNAAPPSVVLFAYTVPSIMIRMFVPYITFPDLRKMFRGRRSDYGKIGGSESQEEIDYAIRLSVCAGSSLLGLQLLAWANHVGVRVLGIALASLSSNIGDMSFLQLATRYPGMISSSFGGYAAGSGAAGLIGSALYTVMTTSFGATPSAVLALVGFFPTIVLLVYLFCLPSAESVAREVRLRSKDISEASPYVEVPEPVKQPESIISTLSLRDKLDLAKPMVWGYMMPLATLMFLENLTTQGILPTVLWNLPFSDTVQPMLASFFKVTRDFYPFFFTVYQLAVFFGRTSITLFRLPGGNRRSSAAYWFLCIIEVFCFFIMFVQSRSMILPMIVGDGTEPIDPNGNTRFSPAVVGAVMFIMGLCGGLGMGNTYWRVSKKPLPDEVWEALDAAKMRNKATRVFERQEQGLLTARSEGEGGDYFSSRSRLRKAPYSPVERRSRGSSAASSPVFAMFGEEGGEEMEEIGLGRKHNQNEETAVREFLVSTIALPDTMAILFASIAGLWLQPELCRWQVAGGRDLCLAAGAL